MTSNPSPPDCPPDVRSDLSDRDPAELTTTELLIVSRLPLDETGDPDRAARARRLARLYLDRRQRRVRQQRPEAG